MNTTSMFVAALIVLAAAGAATWAWQALTEVDERMNALCGFEGMHFEIGTQAAAAAPAATRPAAG